MLSITDDSWCQVHENIAKFCTDITLDSEDINILVLGLQKHISSSSSIQTHKVTKYLLHNVSFVTCLHYHSKLYHTFFEEFIFGDSNENREIFTEMSVCITDAYRKSQANEKILIQNNAAEVKENGDQRIDSIRIFNLKINVTFKENSLDKLCWLLEKSRPCKNLFMFFECIFCFRYQLTKDFRFTEK